MRLKQRLDALDRTAADRLELNMERAAERWWLQLIPVVVAVALVAAIAMFKPVASTGANLVVIVAIAQLPIVLWSVARAVVLRRRHVKQRPTRA